MNIDGFGFGFGLFVCLLVCLFVVVVAVVFGTHFLTLQRNIILPNALSSVCWIAGSHSLKDDYDLEKRKVQDEIAFPNKKQVDGAPLVRKRNAEELVARLLGGHLVEFRPDLSKKKEKQSVFGVKKELYRPFQEVLACLALKFNLKSRSSFDRIDELQSLGVFSELGASNLKIAINAVMVLRLKAHQFYQDEKEYLCFPQEGILRDPNLFYFDEEMLENLRQIYLVLIPFHQYEFACSFIEILFVTLVFFMLFR
jgi:hypothetical protein